MPKGPNDPLAYRIFNEIGIIDQLASAAFRKVLPPPLNTSMFGVLNHFVRLGDGKTPSYLAEAFQVTRPSMTSIIERLAAARLVRVEHSTEDARTKRVWMTKEGRAARDNAVEATSELLGSIEADLETIDLDRLLEMLVRHRSILDNAR